MARLRRPGGTPVDRRLPRSRGSTPLRNPCRYCELRTFRSRGRASWRGTSLALTRDVTRLSISVSTILVSVTFGLAFPGGRAAATGLAPRQAQAAKPAKSAPTSSDLDKLLAPIALYPDALLGQILLCASNPGKVGALREWMHSHENLKGSELQDAVKASGFDPSFVALVLFPQVVDTMADQVEWTTNVGKAFATDRSAVFASIQRLRAKARDAGKLKSTPQQEVETRTTSSGEQVIVIEPANPQVVYVPQYNAQTVYTQSTSSTVVIEKDNSDAAVAAGLIGFTAGIALGAAIDNDYYYGPYGWHGGAYMYNDAWDDWYDDREDAREDWQDNREDLADERGDRAREQQEQRTERTQTRQENRPEAQAQREQRRTEAQSGAAQSQSGAAQSRSTNTVSQESRGYSREQGQATRERSGTQSDAFSGYSGGRSERAASQRGQRSRSSSRGGRR
jgi:hypothetical protein